MNFEPGGKSVMKILKWILIVLVILILGVAGFLAYMGVFSGVNVTEKYLKIKSCVN